MGSSPHQPSPPDTAFLHRFAQSCGPGGAMDFAQFMRLALYDPAVGYYRRPRRRIGLDPETDFYTASSSGTVFGELICAAAGALLAGAQPAGFSFVEIGAETDGGILAGVAHPFAAARTIPLGAPLELRGPCVVFANELFDAQPFRRFVRRAGRWRELGVACRDGLLREVLLPDAPPPDLLPAQAPEGYHVDAPLAAGELLQAIATQSWQGVFITCDYGKSWAELAHDLPAGTARAYHRHTQSNDLLSRPGEQDLTCHVCWDWLADILRAHGFAAITLESQEAFFVRQAGAFIARAAAAEAGRFSPRKQALAQLLHPAHLGRKFQVLHARRLKEREIHLA